MSLLARLFGRGTARPSGPDASAPTAAGHLRAGNASMAQDLPQQAVEHYQRAVEADPLLVDAHVNLGYALIQSGNPMQAEPPLQQALRMAPSSHDAHYLLALALLSRHAHALAIPHLRQAVALAPTLLPAHASLGKALHEVGLDEEAKAALQGGLSVEPDAVELRIFLGNVQLHLKEFDNALSSYRRALEVQPRLAAIHNNVGQVLANLGDVDGAEAAARSALSIDPGMHAARSNLLMILSNNPRRSPALYRAEAAAYGRALAESLDKKPGTRPPEGQAPERHLRVGFVSGDLRRHPVGYFLAETLRHWNHASMDAIAYNNHPASDDLTAELKQSFDRWFDIAGMGDEDVLRRIEADRIDVLVDLSGHTPGNRLPVFARRAAPVQAAWLGFWASTGVETMDFLLADEVSLPPDQREHFTEEIWYLPQTRLCFSPPRDPAAPAVSGLPGAQRPRFTFGSFQRLGKINSGVITRWARVLKAVPGSHLRLQCAEMGDPAARTGLLKRFAEQGIAPDRVELFGSQARHEYLAAHADVDIILDTFPHSGATTTCEALWMGVPTLTLPGETMLSRQTASVLTCIGLVDWVARDEDDYVRRAAAFAQDLPALARLRATLRDRAADTPLFDGRRFTVNLQNACRGMWKARAARATDPDPGEAS